MSVWPWRLLLSPGESQGGNDWLPFPATALLLNWAGLLDLSECTRLRAPGRHLLKQRRVNCWECVAQRGKWCYNSDVPCKFIAEFEQISRKLIKVQFSTWHDDTRLLFGSLLWILMQVSVFAGLGLSCCSHSAPYTHIKQVEEHYTLVDTECCETVNKQIKHSSPRKIIHRVKLIIYRHDAVDHRDLSFMGSFIWTRLRQRV